MLDILDFQPDKGGDLEKLRESQRRRYAPESVVDDIVTMFEDHRKTRYAATQIGSQINALKKEIGSKIKAEEDASDLLAKQSHLGKEKKLLEESAAEKNLLLQKQIKAVGNYVHDSVPISDNEENNEIVQVWTPEEISVRQRECLSYHEVLTRIDGYDPERGVKIGGHRGYYLTGYGLFLNLALVNYGLEFLWNKGYKPNQPPHFMLRDYMAKTAQLEHFDKELYKVTDDDGKDAHKYLIATSEQPLSVLHESEWLQDKDLPIKYAGYSTCYRKGAGSRGRDAWGLLRAHQEEKIEQFLFTNPDESWKAFDEMIGISEEFYQSLGLPYQIVAMVSGALNSAASKRCDLEAWFPSQGRYNELVTCSNTTDYQARALNIRYGAKTVTDIRKGYVHALNSTLCATERALCCILENYQEEKGVRVPVVLRKYVPGAPELIEYTRELPRTPSSQKTKVKISADAKIQK